MFSTTLRIRPAPTFKKEQAEEMGEILPDSTQTTDQEMKRFAVFGRL